MKAKKSNMSENDCLPMEKQQNQHPPEISSSILIGWRVISCFQITLLADEVTS